MKDPHEKGTVMKLTREEFQKYIYAYNEDEIFYKTLYLQEKIIRDIKLNQACRALRETSLSNHAICELVGYESPEHFMRTFKKTYGMTPGEYRKKNKE